MTDKITELTALAVLDVLEAAQTMLDDWHGPLCSLEHNLNRLEDALTRLDRLDVVTEAAA